MGPGRPARAGLRPEHELPPSHGGRLDAGAELLACSPEPPPDGAQAQLEELPALVGSVAADLDVAALASATEQNLGVVLGAVDAVEVQGVALALGADAPQRLRSAAPLPTGGAQSSTIRRPVRIDVEGG